MEYFGLKSLVINSDTTSAASSNLWVDARSKYNMVLLSPEELNSDGFHDLLKQKVFFNRTCMFGVDEIHLIYWWGKSFRPAFQLLGQMRARLARDRGKLIPLVGLTATLREGPPMDSIHKVLGLKPGKYHLIRRSNMRHDIQLIFREMQSGMAGTTFPELNWILDEKDNSLIFCKTIAVGFRVAAHLWQVARSQKMPNMSLRIRLYNSLNWPSYNSETMGLLNNNTFSAGGGSITIATDTLSVGWDSRFTRNAIIFGEPDDIDEFVQKIGRAGRDRQAVPNPRAFLYYKKSAIATAQKISDEADKPRSRQPIHSSTSNDQDSHGAKMDKTIARLLLAPCKFSALNAAYHNPSNDTICGCHKCACTPPPAPLTQCICSGFQCQPEVLINLEVLQEPPTRCLSLVSKKPRARRDETLPPYIRSHATNRLQHFRYQLFDKIDLVSYSFLPPHAFLPDDMIKAIIDSIYSIRNPEDLKPLLVHNHLIDEHHVALFAVCSELKTDFADLRESKRLEMAFLKAISGERPETNIAESEAQESSIRWRINFQNATITKI
jgi:superfamily II DNA helicase RecQ